MADTPGLDMPLLTTGLSGHVPHNKALLILDLVCGRGVVKAQNNAPGSPAEYDAYIVFGTPSSGDAFENHENELAILFGNKWQFFAVAHGCRVYNQFENTFWVKGTTTWSVMGSGQACLVARSTSDRDSTTATWAQINVDTNDLYPSNAFVRGTGGDGVGDVLVKTSGTYLMEFQGEIRTTTGVNTALELGFVVGGSQASITPATNSIRRLTYLSTAAMYRIAHAAHVAAVTAGTYVAPLFRNQGATGTLRIAANLNHFRLTKLSM